MTGMWQRHRATVLIVGSVALLTLLIAWANGSRSSTPWDPENPGPEGARAVAQVLDDHGVDVQVVRSAAALDRADVGAATVVVTSADQLGETTVRRLLARVPRTQLVLVEPPPQLAAGLGVPGGSQVPLADPLAAGCDDPRFRELRLDASAVTTFPTAQGCFPGPGGHVAADADGITLWGAGEALTNRAVVAADNGAAVLRLLGQRDRLVWYVPTVADLPAGDGVGVRAFLPPWTNAALALALIAGLAVIWWLGRRFGPLVVEPLPVVVKALETTLSRGRLYRKAGDRGHAAATLREASRRHLAEGLRLPASTPPDALVAAVAHATERRTEEIAALVDPAGPTPATDRDLITLAQALAELEREVRRP